MSRKTFIEWCNGTWSPWLGCRKVSPGCSKCYIVTTTPFRTRKLKHGDPRQRTSKAYWRQPIKWDGGPFRCDACGKLFEQLTGKQKLCAPIPGDPCQHCNFGRYARPRVFPSLCDWLDDEVAAEWLADFLLLIKNTPNLDWLLLTKRPENFFPLLQTVWRLNSYTEFGQWVLDWVENGKAPANVWIGTSVEDQARADERIPVLLKIPARVRFLSVEPLLGPVNLVSKSTQRGQHYKTIVGTEWLGDWAVNWVIVGGESGPGARQCNIDWIRCIVDQCQSARVPCFVKQLGGNLSDLDLSECSRSSKTSMHHPKGGDPAEWPEDLRVREFPRS